MNLTLRKINSSDLYYFFEIKNDINVLKYLGNNNILDNEQIKLWFNNLINENNTDRFIISDKSDNLLIYGDICIGDIDNNNNSCSLHIKILPKYWGLKIGYNVIDKIINYCKNILDIKIIYISINKNNLRSLNLFKKFNIEYINDINNFNNYKILL